MTKARVEAGDAQRVLLGALNGIAALLSADGKRAEAVSAYRQARNSCCAPYPRKASSQQYSLTLPKGITLLQAETVA